MQTKFYLNSALDVYCFSFYVSEGHKYNHIHKKIFRL